ncbi:2-polyprenyl-6-methoxyphenol hydroxylase-like FAD-dependent oxidoreductase [Novosphingobium chloroacetimidivorans]|uniref:2-polyprenyl-6-methoxyphenol hydroxylase-like FAD-dependent oxidoreductase n=1 Tax=Novosphingobium chloroacetimidivorans TaxID=1428314 RepID=A0A7W7NWR1_9SPHN|nr:FAD-dependent oxidoreductase [Novosphingobium chloroacetimidivorans]MBB4858679.1 2-polyprenyl-6-methoxyphenol hydroxylase-like FAD-dependent oxidoreductase [Novosphingobium chloroacetimidivorans]
MSGAKRILIVGGGISGMTLAAAAQLRGIDVVVVEKARPQDQLGTGINLQNNALQALREIGVLDECLAAGFGWNTITTCDASGKQLDKRELPWKLEPGMPGALGIMRTTLAQILAKRSTELGAKILYQTQVSQLEQLDDGVRVTLSDGTVETVDVVAASDGVYSPTRRLVFGDEHAPFYAGQGAWRYTIPRPRTLDGFTIFRAANGLAVGALPLAPDLAYYFILESTETTQWFEPDQLPHRMAELLSHFDAPEIREALDGVHNGGHISFRPFDILLMPQPWHRGRVVLVGDAAHSLTPQLTSGGGMAIEDGVVLADELARTDDVEAALTAYGRRREGRVGPIYENSLRICEIEKGNHREGDDGVRIFVDSFKLLADRY